MILNKLINTKYKNLMNNIFSLFILQGLNFLLPLIVFPILVNALGMKNFGLLIFAQSFVMFFSIIVDFGFNLSATKQISIHQDNPEKLSEIFFSVMYVKILLFLSSFLIFFIIILQVDKFTTEFSLYIYTFLSIVGQLLFPIWFFQGLEKMKFITIINVISKMIFTTLTFLLIKNENDYLLAALLYSFNFLFIGILSIVIIKMKFSIKFYSPNYQKIKYYFLDSFGFFLSRFSVSLYTSSNILVLGLLFNSVTVGYYSVAVKVYSALQNLYIPISTALYPYMAHSKNINLYRKIFLIIVLFNIILVGILYVYSLDIFNLIFNSYNLISIKIYKILLIASIVVVPSILLGYPLLAAFGYTKFANNSIIIGSVYHLISLYILYIYNSLNIYTVAYLLLSTEVLVFLIKLYGTNKLMKVINA